MSVVSSHHTVWVHCDACEPRAARYALDGGRLLAFGDRSLAAVPAGIVAQAAVHEIANGPPLAQFGVRVHEVDGATVDRQAFLSLLDHVALGRDTAEIERSIEGHARRRLLALEPTGPTG